VEGRIQFKVFPPFTCNIPPASRIIEPPGWARCLGGMREAGGDKRKVALCLWFFHNPPAPFHLVRPRGLGITGFVGDWWRTAITPDNDASSPIRLNQWREAKERMVRGRY